MPSKSARKLHKELDRAKAIRQKDLGIRLMVLGPLLSYAALLFMNSGTLFMPIELYSFFAMAGFALILVGTFLVERAFRTLIEATGGAPSTAKPKPAGQPEANDAAARR